MEKKYIIKSINELPKEDRQTILQVIQTMTSNISEHADGCRINLDKLHDTDVQKLYHLIKNKIEYHQIMYSV